MISRDEILDVFAAALPGIVLSGVLALLTGCASTPQKSAEQGWADNSQENLQAPPKAAGAIWRSGESVMLFEDQRARNIGDVLTILLMEETTAKSSAATSTAKATTGSISAPTLFGRPVTIGGTNVLEGSLESKHDFSGKGDTTQSNKLEGSITCTVIGVQRNGNLVVRGEKRLQLNQGSEFVKIEGVVRPTDIAPDNTIPSSRIASARIAYSGEGTLAESNTKGWLARFFSSPLMPF